MFVSTTTKWNEKKKKQIDPLRPPNHHASMMGNLSNHHMFRESPHHHSNPNASARVNINITVKSKQFFSPSPKQQTQQNQCLACLTSIQISTTNTPPKQKGSLHNITQFMNNNFSKDCKFKTLIIQINLCTYNCKIP